MLIFSFSLQHSAKVLCSGQGIFASSFVHASALGQLQESLQIAKNTNVNSEEDKYSDRNIFRQYALNKSND